jgi:hypothetical protein
MSLATINPVTKGLNMKLINRGGVQLDVVIKYFNTRQHISQLIQVKMFTDDAYVVLHFGYSLRIGQRIVGTVAIRSLVENF